MIPRSRCRGWPRLRPEDYSFEPRRTGPTCIANSAACDACVTTTFCKSQLAACAPDMACATAVNTSQNCVCAAQGANSQTQQSACITTVMNSGMLAAAVSTCIATNCKTQCLI